MKRFTQDTAEEIALLSGMGKKLSDLSKKNVSRRGLLTATAAGSLLAAAHPVLAQNSQGIKPANENGPTSANRSESGGDTGGNNPGPKNLSLRAENTDSFNPPSTDHGDEPAFKYSFSLGHNRRQPGGWARQVTVKDFPISTTIAGVNMRLERGAIRELHWHLPAEWSYMLYGTARITGVDQNGRSFVRDVKQGDLWYFPSGIPHSIQGLAPDGCEFLLVFDDGAFSEFDTFLITDWMAHTPRSVLAKNFSVPVAAFNQIPDHELYIFPAPLPASLSADQKAATGPQLEVPEPFDYRLGAQAPNVQNRSGQVKIADSHNFKSSKTIASALVTVHPGGMRELHWHPNADEWQYWIAGQGRMTVFAAGGRARTMDFQAGDVGYILRNMGHYIENTGNSDMTFLEMFRSDHYEDISLGEWISHLPPELVMDHLHISQATYNAIPKQKLVLVPA